MAVEITPLGFKKPDGNELVRGGDNAIADNAQKAQDLLANTRSRVGAIEAGIIPDPGLIEDADNPGTFFLAPGTGIVPDPSNPGFYVMGAAGLGVNRLVSVGEDLALPPTVKLTGANMPGWYGPRPGAADNAGSLNAYLAANAGGTVSLWPGATYIVNSTVNVPTDTDFNLNGATLDFRGMAGATELAQRYGIRSDGSLGAQVVVSTAVAKWSRTITGIASTAGFAVGDTVLISNDEAVVPGMNLTSRDKAELNTIATVSTGTVTLNHGAVFAYGTAGLTIRKVNPVKNVTIRNGNIIMGGVTKAHNGAQVEYGRNIRIEGIRCDGAEDVGLGLRAVLNGDINNCAVINSTSNTSLNKGPTGYGACVWDASRHIRVTNNYFENSRHHVAGGGIWPAVFVDVMHNDGRTSSSAAYDCHEPCHYWTFFKNTAENSSHGIFVRGQYVTLELNEVSDISQEAYAVHVYNEVTEQRGIRLLNNSANRCGYGISVGKASGETLEYVSYDLEITGNTMMDCGTNPIRVRMFDGAKISRNTVTGGVVSGILLEGASTSLRSKNLTMDGNDVRNTGIHGIWVRYVDDIEATGGQIVNAGEHGLYLLDCNRSSLALKVRGSVEYGIFIDGGTAHSLGACHVSGGTGSVWDALRVSNVTGLNVSGGYYASPRYAIYTDLTTPVLITGAYVKDTVHATKINCDAATQVIANNLV